MLSLTGVSEGEGGGVVGGGGRVCVVGGRRTPHHLGAARRCGARDCDKFLGSDSFQGTFNRQERKRKLYKNVCQLVSV